jgi:hypothetical protein
MNKEHLLKQTIVCTPPPLPTTSSHSVFWHKSRDNTEFVKNNDYERIEIFADSTRDQIIEDYLAIVLIKQAKLSLCVKWKKSGPGQKIALKGIPVTAPEIHAICYILAKYLPKHIDSEYENYIENSNQFIEGHGLVVRIDRIGVIIRKNGSVSFCNYLVKHGPTKFNGYPQSMITWSIHQAKSLLKWWGCILTPMSYKSPFGYYVEVWHTAVSPARYIEAESDEDISDYEDQLYDDYESDEGFYENLNFN